MALAVSAEQVPAPVLMFTRMQQLVGTTVGATGRRADVTIA